MSLVLLPPSVELTQAEWAIMKALWNQEPCTAPDIQEALHAPTGWAYSTVRTLMDGWWPRAS